ncbi:MAG: phytoene/squalene synthase family protein [Terriglobales bacterium]
MNATHRVDAQEATPPVSANTGENENRPPAPAPVAPLQLTAAYAVCRSISRRNARNFYYGFLVLPREKRDALCAVYAFMRHADDISDDPSLSASERRARLAAWLDEFRRVTSGGATDDPVLIALADTQYRYAIPPALLETLVEGTATDVEVPSRETGEQATAESEAEKGRRETGNAVTFASFDDLYRYCYQVASVVGLVSIRIFGYRDPAAERLAERLGIAFQLTNIIRDVKEDAAMGRVYLPLEDLEKFDRSPAELVSASRGAAAQGAQHAGLEFRPVLEFECQRARDYYAVLDRLLPLIDDDSRPALWTLATIYRSLLEKIAARGYDVFSERVRLTTAEKLLILLKGLWQRVT